MPRLSFFTALFFCSRGTTLTILFSCPAFWYFSQLFYAFSQFSRFFGASDSFFSFYAPFILFHCPLFLFLGHHTHNSLLMPRFWYFSQLFYAFSQFSRFFGAPGSFSPFLCPVYPFSLLSFSVPGAPHSQFSSHAPLFGIFLNFSMLSHNFLGFSGHLTLFSLSMPRLSFFTALFFYSWGTTLTILFSCPAFGTFLNFSMLSHNFLGFSGHLALFPFPVPRLSFFTVLFFCSRGTTLTILFSCPTF